MMRPTESIIANMERKGMDPEQIARTRAVLEKVDRTLAMPRPGDEDIWDRIEDPGARP